MRQSVVSRFCFCLVLLSRELARCSAPNELERVIRRREEIISSIAHSAKNLHQSRNRMLAICSCSYHSCGNQFGDGLTCTDELSFGTCENQCGKRLVDYSRSVVRTPLGENPYSLSPSIKQSICTYHDLEADLADVRAEYNVSNSWTYFGTIDGHFRTWPLRARVKGVDDKDTFFDGCKSYDPRKRPWYAAASTGPKDVVLVLDKSTTTQRTIGQLGNSFTLWDVIQNAAASLLDTFTFADQVNIVFFSAQAERAEKEVPLIEANIENTKRLGDAVRRMEPDGSTNVSAAMKEAFQIFIETSEGNATTGCNKVIILLLDGSDTTQSNSNILKEISQHQRDLKKKTNSEALIFAYSIGTDSDDSLARQIACANGGVWSQTTSVSEPISDMTSYLETLALARNETHVVWMYPYLDSSGLGIVTSVSVPVFRRGPKGQHPILIGVVGHDVILNDLEVEGGANYTTVLDELVKRSIRCQILNITQCRIQVQRKSDSDQSVCADTYPERQCYEFQNRYYRFISKKLDRERAEGHCQKLGGTLASIRSEQQYHFLSGISSADCTWLSGVRGLSKLEIRFFFNDPEAEGMRLRDEAWAVNQEDSHTRSCMAIDRRGITRNLERHACTDQLSFICEFTTGDSCDGNISNVTSEAGGLKSFEVPSPNECPELLKAYEELKPTSETIDLDSQNVLCELGKLVFHEENICCQDCDDRIEAVQDQSALTRCHLFLTILMSVSTSLTFLLLY